jgi:hypothetical protein
VQLGELGSVVYIGAVIGKLLMLNLSTGSATAMPLFDLF